jgi:TonB-dependent receptor
MLQRIFSTAIFSFFALATYAQTGSIKGNITDGVSGESIIGANVLIAGTTQGTIADINGDFQITKVKAGTYNIVVSFISYKTDTLKNITVYADQTTVLNTKLFEQAQELNEVVITGSRVTNTDVSVITEIKKADLIAVGISAQQISMSQDRDAAQIMKRLPGITISNNRFINVRGLSERYSTVMLNGVIAPSTEIDSKAFSFDLIPGGLVDRMLVYMSGAPELPGEFAGADVKIFTKSIVEENSLSVSLSGSFRSGTTGKTFQLSQEKSPTDWLGRDNGTRALPSTFPSVNLRTLDPSGPNDNNILTSATKSLPYTWGTRNVKASPDFRANIDFARTMRLFGKKIDNLTSVSYTRSNQKLELSQNYYETFSSTLQKSNQRYDFHDVRFSQVSRIGAISNFTLEISPSHKIEFRNFFNQQGTDQSTFRTGIDGTNEGGFEVRNQAFNYLSRSIYSGQLSGKHNFSNAVAFDWVFGYNQTTAQQPDYRRARSQRNVGTDDPFQVQINSSATAYDAGRFYSQLVEKTYSAAGNLAIKLSEASDDAKQPKLIAGYYLEQKNRSFNARWMSYIRNPQNNPDLELLNHPITEVLSPQNIDHFMLSEGTNVGNGHNDPKDPGSYDRYDGSNRLIAGYAGVVTPFAENFNLSAGIRVENNVQLINVYDLQGKKQNVVNNPLTVPMPFVNLSYNFSEKMLVRGAYSKTVNRAVFRELAPFSYYDFDRNADIFGNPLLKTAKIDNAELKWELYPTRSESISFGAFYKNFKNPIEQFLGSTSNLTYSFGNAQKAVNYGLEAQVRKSLDKINVPVINHMTVVFNATYIKSNITVDTNNSQFTDQEKNRALQGQSPYVLNTSLFYSDVDRGLQISVQHNVFGKRIFAVGNSGNANQYEMPRNIIDLTVSKDLTKHLQIKFGIQDLLNQRYRIIQDSNHDKKITKVDESIQTYRWGQYGTLGITWRF